MRDDVNVVEVIELKRTQHMAHGHPSEFCMQFMQRETMPIINEDSHLLPMDDFKVEQHYAKKFHINGEDRYIIWSMELETLVGMPLKLFDDLYYEVDQLNLRLTNKQHALDKMTESEEHYRKWSIIYEDRDDVLRQEVHTQKVIRNVLGLVLVVVGAMVGFNVI